MSEDDARAELARLRAHRKACRAARSQVEGEWLKASRRGDAAERGYWLAELAVAWDAECDAAAAVVKARAELLADLAARRARAA